ncbi:MULTISPECIES: glycoside hydrolase family 3 N-terminal domain-containing protein [unclassified Brevibacterium]|uniref:glycoside hydrolase family 3 N-terminal domain-containing protein n=1 Tax=unclassified Brevibacterium TaxID=2614124 RepID=UPI001E3C5D8B|nr:MULTISPECIES: glycoside hydrolase family 3 N-terminal domain-containing protein [unclassified Brevibacterium]MCD1285662.1 glycosyl hydrolase [Brevibacterium sp. CCUG 69071]MDK8434720.1 glycoside hydrolase family 3 N-terminal domain-containing protein [Brevibacterium sp. H-BE7]
MRPRLGIIALTTALALAGCSGGSAERDPGAESGGDAQSGQAQAESTPSPEPSEVEPADFADEAKDIVADFSDEELAGSLIIGTWSGTDTQTAVNMVEGSHLGGVIVMADNLPENPTSDQVTGVTEAISGARTKDQPVSIGVDQEGGPVSRLSTAALPFPPLMAFGAAKDSELTQTATKVQGQNLTDLGFTIDFAPDADVTTGEKDVAVNVRSAGDDHKQAAEVVGDATTGYRLGGVATSAKHFPGHGRLDVDSHKSLPVSKKSIDELADTDLLPFESAVDAGIPMVMMGHIGLPDAKTTPATLNKKAYAALRDKLDFDGVIVTDALNMEAVDQNLSGGETVKALAAGADLALMPPDSAAAQKAVVSALGDGTLKKDDLVAKAERVVAMQLATAEVQKSAGETGDSGSDAVDAAADGSEADGSEDPEKVLTEVAEKSLTVLKGKCSFVGTDAISIVGGSEKEKAALTEAAKKAGLEVGSGGTSVSLSPGTSAEVAVGTAAPWTMRSTSAKSAVTAYDSNPYALGAVVKWLKGDLEASGQLPVDYEGSDKAPDCG